MSLLLAELAASLPDAAEVTRTLVRLLAALLAGGIIGYQREASGKAAGLRTHMLVCAGTALFVLAVLDVGMQQDGLSRVIHVAFDLPHDGPDPQGIRGLRQLLYAGLNAMWPMIEATANRQILTYEITTYSLRQRASDSEPGGRIAVNVASVEALVEANRLLKEMTRDVQVWDVHVSRGVEQLDRLRFHSTSPSYLLAAGRQQEAGKERAEGGRQD